MIVTTTTAIEGFEISFYEGMVFGEVISGINLIIDMGAGLRNMFGGRAQGYENELLEARSKTLEEMEFRELKGLGQMLLLE